MKTKTIIIKKTSSAVSDADALAKVYAKNYIYNTNKQKGKKHEKR